MGSLRWTYKLGIEDLIALSFGPIFSTQELAVCYNT